MNAQLSLTLDASSFRRAARDLLLSLAELPEAAKDLIPSLVESPHLVLKLGVVERDNLPASVAGVLGFTLKPSEGFLALLAAARAGDLNLGVIENCFGHNSVSVGCVEHNHEERAPAESQGSVGVSPPKSQGV